MDNNTLRVMMLTNVLTRMAAVIDSASAPNSVARIPARTALGILAWIIATSRVKPDMPNSVVSGNAINGAISKRNTVTNTLNFSVPRMPLFQVRDSWIPNTASMSESAAWAVRSTEFTIGPGRSRFVALINNPSTAAYGMGFFTMLNKAARLDIVPREAKNTPMV